MWGVIKHRVKAWFCTIEHCPSSKKKNWKGTRRFLCSVQIDTIASLLMTTTILVKNSWDKRPTCADLIRHGCQRLCFLPFPRFNVVWQGGQVIWHLFKATQHGCKGWGEKRWLILSMSKLVKIYVRVSTVLSKIVVL